MHAETMPVLLLAALLAGCGRGNSGAWQVYDPNQHVLYGGRYDDKPIRAPRRWALIQFADGPIDGPEVDAWSRGVLKAGLQQAEADLDADGRQELFLRQNVPGRSWTVLVFTRVRGGYRYMGDISGGAFQVLPPGRDGRPRIKVREAYGGHLFRIETYKFDGERFQSVASEHITAGDGEPEENNRRLNEFFGAGTGILRWR